MQGEGGRRERERVSRPVRSWGRRAGGGPDTFADIEEAMAVGHQKGVRDAEISRKQCQGVTKRELEMRVPDEPRCVGILTGERRHGVRRPGGLERRLLERVFGGLRVLLAGERVWVVAAVVCCDEEGPQPPGSEGMSPSAAPHPVAVCGCNKTS